MKSGNIKGIFGRKKIGRARKAIGWKK